MSTRRTPAGSVSLERTLVFRVVAVTVVGLVAVTLALLWTLAIHLRSAADDDLAAAVDVVSSTEDGPGSTIVVDENRLARILPPRTLVAVITVDGQMQVLSAAAIDVALLPIDPRDEAPFAFRIGMHRYRGAVVDADSLALAGASGEGGSVEVDRVLVAIDVTSDRQTVRTVSLVALALTLLTTLALAVVGRTVIRRSLAPLNAIAATASKIAESGVAEPMPVDTPFAETEAIARSVDDAITRRTIAERAIRDFVADASHELRTPIAKVQGWSEVLLEGRLDSDKSRDAIERIVGAAEELGGVVDELALLASLDVTPHVTKEPVDVGALAREVTEDAVVAAADATVTCHVAEGIGVINADAAALRRALRNLVGNAVQHGGGIVTVAVTRDSGVILIEVADEGPGIAATVRGRVFDRFFTTSPGRGRHSGLGLAIVDAVARAHGGTVTLRDSGRGAHFVLSLPTSSGDRQEDVSHTEA